METINGVKASGLVLVLVVDEVSLKLFVGSGARMYCDVRG